MHDPVVPAQGDRLRKMVLLASVASFNKAIISLLAMTMGALTIFKGWS